MSQKRSREEYGTACRAIAFGSDHAGFVLKKQIMDYVRATYKDIAVKDFGTDAETNRVDYPDIAATVCKSIQSGEFNRGVLLDGAGVASGSLIASHIMDWSKETFIKGAYSYQKVGTGDSRSTLAQSVDDKLFFAGEATNTEGHEATVHGAIQTADTAVEELVSKE